MSRKNDIVSKETLGDMSIEKVRGLSTAHGGNLAECPYLKKVRKGWFSREWLCTAISPERKIPDVEAYKLCESPANWPDCPNLIGRHSPSKQLT